jgi:hypothetical protein
MSPLVMNPIRSRGSARASAARAHARARRALVPAIAAPVLIAVLGCGGGGSRDAALPRDAQKLSSSGETVLTDTTSEFPRLRFADGQVSMNDRCMVRQVKLNPRLPALYVNGRPVGFC